jgi:hypothetical protein
MRKPAHNTKLHINAETIRVLDSADLARAAGGEERAATGGKGCVVALAQYLPAIPDPTAGD